MQKSPARGARWLSMLLTVALVSSFCVQSAQAVDFTLNDDGTVREPTDNRCPTFTRAPEPISVFFNTSDTELRGFADPGNQDAWDYAAKVAQAVCGAAEGSTITIGMFFVRALGTITSAGLGDRPESDPEVIYKALEYVKNERNVKIGLVLEDGDITGAGPKAMINKRLKGVLDLYWCRNGCFNINGGSTYRYAVNHEKFMTISDTTWPNSDPGPHPFIYSSSGNWARSQVRNFWQETTFLYGDKILYDQFVGRYKGMIACAQVTPRGTKATCRTDSGFPDILQLQLKNKIWVDPFYRHYTDSGRGTTVSFSPAPVGTRDFYIQQFDDVDCVADSKVRIAMYQLSEAKATSMIDSLKRLIKRGCDVKMVLTGPMGSSFVSRKVVSKLKKAKINAKCTALPLHTKMIVIGPTYGNTGRVLTGTVNMSVAGLRYSEEHVLTFDTRRASAAYSEALQRAYGDYLQGWYDLAKDSKAC